jgi:radical SAM superfamily enzyme YgiQ (UPF0313 family)
MFCDNNFNAPRQHAEAILRALIVEKAELQWGSGDLRPSGVTDSFCRLMEESGCFYANLSVESASESVLKRMKRGYTPQQVRNHGAIQKASEAGLCRQKPRVQEANRRGKKR